MFKNLIRLALGLLLLAGPASMSAQAGDPMAQPLPLMVNPVTGESYVRSGKLPNGLSYYILHNAEPKGRANFYIAQKVGSTLENPQQLGLAHFLEHMAFNGTENYPGKNMLNYLQSKSLRFGADINAYTSFDETVYNIDNVPTSDKPLMDSVLLVLRDWSCAITLDGDEIDAERKVIQEEWRTRDGAGNRFYTNMLPAIYQEYQYQQMPIGKMEVVMNFPYEDLRSYYRKWYRPDQQGIVVVGDFDAAEMEAKVKEMFSSIPMPENAAPRTYPSVSDNREPIYFQYEDAEAPYSLAWICFKQDETPFAERNSLGWWLNDVTNDLVTRMLDNRLNEFAQKPECEYASAGVDFGDFFVSKTKDAFTVQVQPKGDDVAKATRQAMEIVARACQTGFTDTEYQRAKDDLQSLYETRKNELNTTRNGVLAKRLIRHFIDNNALPGAELDYQLFQMISGQIPVQAINQGATQLLTDTNQCIVVFNPKKEGYTLPGREAMLAAVEGAIHKQYEAYKDEVITEPLIAKAPKAGKIAKAEKNETFGTTVFTLSNGAKVILKTTDFKSDEIRFNCFAPGGFGLFNPADPKAVSDLNMIGTAVESSKLGNFTNTMMRKYLAGKNVSCGFGVNNRTHGLTGYSVKKDLPVLMEIVYSYFTQLNPDAEQYAVDLKKECTDIERGKNDPMTLFSDTLTYSMFNGDPRFAAATVARAQAADYSRMLATAKGLLANAADYTFIFVGNVDEATLRPLLESYIASLPSKGKATKAGKTWPVSYYTGTRTVAFDKPMATPATTYYSFTSGQAKIDALSDIDCSLAGSILSNLFTEVIREKEGAAYSPGAIGRLNEPYGRWEIIRVIATNSEQQNRAFELADSLMTDVLAGKVTEEQFQKVKGAAVNQFDIKLRDNGFWMSTLRDNELGYDTYLGHKQQLDNLTLPAFQEWCRALRRQNTLTVIMTGVPQK